MEGEESTDPSVSRYFNPKRAEKLQAIPTLTESGKARIRLAHLKDEMSQREIYIERYFDQDLAISHLKRLVEA